MNKTEKYLNGISHLLPSENELQRILSSIDLTSLEGKDNEKSITELCEKAKKFKTAAVCIYPSLVSAAKKQLKGTNIKIASVAGGFPSGQLPLTLRLKEALFALTEGADEIDMVISRGKFLEHNHAAITEEVSAFKKLCGTKILKVILETGELATNKNIAQASKIAIDSGADFLKTSTGKIAINATPASVCVMLLSIRDSKKKVGIKPSGGIPDGLTAVKYLRLVENVLGKEWIHPNLLRFGSSRLADAIFAQTADGKNISRKK
jgi:deoxyribose-phosphate aldolase